ncbi:MAG: anti-anti-sigma factor [Runella slithyformis]|nr:MAG: anti-anti-sigma factor [Runella slithyformis]
MNHQIQKHEQYALVTIQETTLDSTIATDLEETARTLFREGFKNLILDFTPTTATQAAGISVLKKINFLCTKDLGIMVLVSENDDFIDQLIEGKMRDVTILPTIEEAIDAVFMNELENEFGAESDDFNDDELDEEGFTNQEKP